MRKTKPVTTGIAQVLYCTFEEWMNYSGMRKDAVYGAIHAGKIRAKKYGDRTMIHVPSGLAYLENLPDFRPRRRTPEPETVAA